MARCYQATSHYLSQCRPSSVLPYGITWPQWVKEKSFMGIFSQCFRIKNDCINSSAIFLFHSCLCLPGRLRGGGLFQFTSRATRYQPATSLWSLWLTKRQGQLLGCRGVWLQFHQFHWTNLPAGASEGEARGCGWGMDGWKGKYI